MRFLVKVRVWKVIIISEIVKSSLEVSYLTSSIKISPSFYIISRFFPTMGLRSKRYSVLLNFGSSLTVIAFYISALRIAVREELGISFPSTDENRPT